MLKENPPLILLIKRIVKFWNKIKIPRWNWLGGKWMSIIVTGGAGFIGSCIVRTLNDNGKDDIIIVDNIGSTNKWKNLNNKRYMDYVNKSDFINNITFYDGIEAIIHMGACSSTTEKNFDYLWNNNVIYTKKLWKFCIERNVRFIYASSAATYGNGSLGFSDKTNLDDFRPMNGYGYSKHIFDIWAKKQIVKPKQYVGLKFFNVYGPNEYCKGNMASMVYHGYNQIKETGKIKLFKSYRKDVDNGMQSRDFVYVKDICDAIMWFLANPGISGLFNIGTGEARSFKELAEAIFEALGMEPNIEYIDMPVELMDKYQYYTKGENKQLLESGFIHSFYSVRGGSKEGVKDYVQNYLEKGYEIY